MHGTLVLEKESWGLVLSPDPETFLQLLHRCPASRDKENLWVIRREIPIDDRMYLGLSTHIRIRADRTYLFSECSYCKQKPHVEIQTIATFLIEDYHHDRIHSTR